MMKATQNTKNVSRNLQIALRLAEEGANSSRALTEFCSKNPLGAEERTILQNKLREKRNERIGKHLRKKPRALAEAGD